MRGFSHYHGFRQYYVHRDIDEDVPGGDVGSETAHHPRYVFALVGSALILTMPEFNLQKDGEQAYATFSAAAQHKALKMIMTTS
jgi:hypothetical protein